MRIIPLCAAMALAVLPSRAAGEVPVQIAATETPRAAGITPAYWVPDPWRPPLRDHYAGPYRAWPPANGYRRPYLSDPPYAAAPRRWSYRSPASRPPWVYRDRRPTARDWRGETGYWTSPPTYRWADGTPGIRSRDLRQWRW